MKLHNKSKSILIADSLEKADTFFSRTQGLIGRSTLPKGATLWIPRCNWIHTCFMKFSIDVIYVDKHLKVCRVDENIKPWRFGKPVFKAKSVFEFSAGGLTSIPEIGDQLDVVH